MRGQPIGRITQDRQTSHNPAHPCTLSEEEGYHFDRYSTRLPARDSSSPVWREMGNATAASFSLVGIIRTHSMRKGAAWGIVLAAKGPQTQHIMLRRAFWQHLCQAST